MTSSGEKCGALVGEKSQTVHSANWKLDAMLKREKQMLDISKRRVEHRITMDKQVVRKRFHMKLHRSKLHHARMTGNTEMLQKLLVQGNFDNNYGAGNDDSLNLINSGKKPARNIKSASARLIRAKEREMRSTMGSRLGSRCLTPKQEDSLAHAKAKRPNTAMELERKLSVPTKPTNDGTQPSSPIPTRPPKQWDSLDQAKVKRPNTAIESERKLSVSTKPTNDGTQPSSPIPARPTHIRDDSKRCVQKVRPVTAAGTKINDDQFRGNKTGLLHKDGSNVGTRPKTAIGTMPSTKDPHEEGNSTISCNATSESVRKKEDQDTIKSNQGTPSIFNEKPKLTLLDLQMTRIRRANFSNRIKSFTKSIPSHLKVDMSDVIDLYSADLVDKVNIEDQDGTRQRKSEMSVIDSKVDRNEELRSIGNINAPNMTFKELNINYRNTTSECIETVPFLRRSSGLAGMLRHRTSSKLSIPSTAWESDEEDFSD